MGVMMEFSVNSDDFRLGRMLPTDPGVEVDVEKLAPMGDGVMPLLWISGDMEAFEENLDENGVSYSVVITDTEGDRKLYRAEWNGEEDALIQAVLNTDGAVIDAKEAHGEWKFRMLFGDRENLSDFSEYCAEHGVDINVQRMYSPIEVTDGSRTGMTTTQVETLVDAFEAGYFKVPRETTLVELSEKYGISDQAVSERLRRATAELIESTLLPKSPELEEA